MGRRPNGTVSVINVDKDDLPDLCSRCLFFDYQPDYTGPMEVRRPEYDYFYEEWKYWDGVCRRHPPTTKGNLPSVTGDTIGCGDGISGRVRWERGETGDVDDA